MLSSAVAKEIGKNLSGLSKLPQYTAYTKTIQESGSYRTIGKTRYTNDSQITDHYAIIPTGQGFGALNGLNSTSAGVYDLIVKRFLSIFYPAAEYERLILEYTVQIEDDNGVKTEENLSAGSKILKKQGYLEVAGTLQDSADETKEGIPGGSDSLKKGTEYTVDEVSVKEGETSPPKRYTSGSMILAMENAGSLIEDEELRSQIKGSGIGTSATRAEILKKLVTIKYLSLNSRTQVITPTLTGEMIYEAVQSSMKQMLNPELTASWEKGLAYVAEGTISPDEYMEKLNSFVAGRVSSVQRLNNQNDLRQVFDGIAANYRSGSKRK